MPDPSGTSTIYTLTLMTTLDPHSPLPVVVSIREDTNTQYDFLLTVISFIEQGALGNGDVLIFDNWAGHLAEDTADLLPTACGHAGVRILRLPTYSPELSPCELVFGLMKQHLRSHRGSSRFLYELL